MFVARPNDYQSVAQAPSYNVTSHGLGNSGGRVIHYTKNVNVIFWSSCSLI